MDPNPFADLIPQKSNVGSSPFADLIPQSPRVPMSGLSPEEDASAWAEMNARGLRPQPTFTGRITDAITSAANDPGGALFGSIGKIGEKAGLLDEGEKRGERFGRALVQSLGPLGYEFAPISSVPRAAPVKATPMPRASVRSEAELRATGGARMGEAKQSASVVESPVLESSVAKFRDDLNSAALEIDPDLHPTAAKVMRKMDEAVANPMSLADLHRLRMKVQTVIENGVKPNGSANQEGLIGQKMKAAVDEMIAAHPEGATFKQGSSEYARAEQSSIITEALEKAKNTAQWQRGDHAGAIRNAVKPLLNNKRYKKTWTPEVRKALAKVRRFGTLEALGGLGSTGYAGFTLGRVAEAVVGLPPGVMFPFGYAARQSANANKARALEGVAEMIRAGGPVAERRLEKLNTLFTPKVLEHVAEKAEGAKRIAAWASSPTPQTARALAAYTSSKLNAPQLVERIMAELRNTEDAQAQE